LNIEAAGNLAGLWCSSVARVPQSIAVRWSDGQLTYRQAHRSAFSLARKLVEDADIQTGDRVAIFMDNCPQFFLAYWAILLAGGTVCAISPRMGRVEADSVFLRSGAKVLICDPKLKPDFKSSRLKVRINSDQIMLSGRQEGGGEQIDCSSDLPGLSVDANQIAILVHTSGTTGDPKIAVMTHDDIFFNLKVAIEAHSLRESDAILSGVPMFHCTPLYSLIPACASLGACFIVTAATSALQQASHGRQCQASVWFGVPTLFHQLALAPATKDPGKSAGRDPLPVSMRLLAYAGSPMRSEIIARLRQRWPKVGLHNFFGLTETISMTHLLPSSDALTHADSIGQLLPGIRACIVDGQGREVATGEVGELCFHRDNVIGQYWAAPGQLAESFDGHWFHTGDLARVDEKGYFFLQGRSKDMIIVSGENVYASEVERVIAACPGVRDVAVLGIEAFGVRASLGELVKAVVVPEEEQTVNELDIKRFCSKKLASYKVPHIVEFRKSLPRNATGKIIKSQLKNL
jgi:long-chain acyl-CoA synthetase